MCVCVRDVHNVSVSVWEVGTDLFAQRGLIAGLEAWCDTMCVTEASKTHLLQLHLWTLRIPLCASVCVCVCVCVCVYAVPRLCLLLLACSWMCFLAKQAKKTQ